MEPTPRTSRSSSTSSSSSRRRANAPLSIDLSNLPPVAQPTKASNTLLFTNLDSLDIFTADNLSTIRDLVQRTAPIHAFAPLKSFRRIVISFWDIDSAIAVRQVWDGENVLGERLKVFYGQNTPLQAKEEHLALPDAGKLFFISPPPSPPAGWEGGLEDAPNKQVHAEDLSDALAKLRHHNDPNAGMAIESPVSPVDAGLRKTRSRSSTLIYQPDEKSPHMPAVVVEDMDEEPEYVSPLEGKPILAHTARPPVELMNDA